MKTYFKLELKNALISWKTVLCIFINLALFMIPYLGERAYPYPDMDGVDYFIRISHFSYVGYIALIVLFLVYSASIIKDKESWFMNKILKIISTKAYFGIKFLINTIITACIFPVS